MLPWHKGTLKIDIRIGIMLRRISIILRKRKDLSKKTYHMLTRWRKLSLLSVIELSGVWNLGPIDRLDRRRVSK
jgi:hypothetical protein